jgi:hypothetical protein
MRQIACRTNVYLASCTVAVVLAVVAFATFRTSPPEPAARFRSRKELYNALIGKTAQEVREMLGEPDNPKAYPLHDPLSVWYYDRLYWDPKNRKLFQVKIAMRDGIVDGICLWNGKDFEVLSDSDK